MLISVAEEGRAGASDMNSDAHEYQTANELFEILTKNRTFEINDMALESSDLVILYKNLELGTKLMSDANELKNKSPNQYVESVVYNEDPESEGSDIGDFSSSEDVHNIFTVNDERIDLLNNMPSFENTLCQKFGIVDLQSSKLNTDYDNHLLFNDLFVQGQLKNLNSISQSQKSDSQFLPASLLDYICCKRLEDNYNFYMDNIIKYVQQTIDQLKRISNGDYLTEKAKEKWREVKNGCGDRIGSDKTVLTSSTNIPFHVEKKRDGCKGTWDDIVHSEMDVRSLTKILEKKIVVEIPKLLCGSYKLFSKCYKNNFIISCQKEKMYPYPTREQNPEKREKESRVEVILKLKRSDSGHMISNIDSIMILKSLPPIVSEPETKELLALEFNRAEDPELNSNSKIIELSDDTDITDRKIFTISSEYGSKNNEGTAETDCYNNEAAEIDSSISDKNYYNLQRYECKSSKNNVDKRSEADFDIASFDDLQITIQRLNMQSPVVEENEDASIKKKRSPTRVRIKSPYENKSYIIEEKKRKKLLEIREKREKRKTAMSESCKITKHKHGKGAIVPQASSSVTKLSITNKSFYNSIYGQNINNIDNKNLKKVHSILKKPHAEIDNLDENDVQKEISLLTPEKNSQKYINRSYYLDEADTEIMHLQIKKHNVVDDSKDNTSSSSQLGANLNLLQQILIPSATDLSVTDTSSSLHQNELLDNSFLDKDNSENINYSSKSAESIEVIVPSNTPKMTYCADEKDYKKSTSSLECRKSIDKIYDLMKKIKSPKSLEVTTVRSKITFESDKIEKQPLEESSVVQVSSSGTSIKHQITSSNPSCFSFEKSNNTELKKNFPNKKTMEPVSIVPKVIISTKSQAFKNDGNKCRKEKNLAGKVNENPLKAISQLLHEFDNVQKNRNKNGNETKSIKKTENSTADGKSGSRQYMNKRNIQPDPHLKDESANHTKYSPLRERKSRYSTSKEFVKIFPQQQLPINDKPVDKLNKKKLADMLDEVKELRGEAVRGPPPKRSSRLNNLAQPKKSYVQAHHKEYQSRYGRNVVSNRLHKLANPLPIPERSLGSTSIRSRQKRGAELLTSPIKQPHIVGAPLDKDARTRQSARSASSSPERSRKHSPVLVKGSSYKFNVMETLKPLHKKMVAVEKYVKNHFGRISPTLDLEDARGVHKSRVPLIPTDIELASMASSPTAEESSTLGKKLHHIIDSMVNTNISKLTALTEYNESSSEIVGIDAEEVSDNIFKCEETSGSDYAVDIFEDKNIVTAVSTRLECKNESSEVREINSMTNCNMKSSSAGTELQNLENALYRQLSSGNFQKRLRIKKLTLTPKHSLQQVLVLQSGDAGNLVLKSTLSQNIDLYNKQTLSQMKILPALSNAHVDCNFAQFPMQIATVGYVFPEFELDKDSFTKNRTVNKSSCNFYNKHKTFSEQNISRKWSKTIQCFKGTDMRTSDKNVFMSGNSQINEKNPKSHDNKKEPEKSKCEIKLNNISYDKHVEEHVSTANLPGETDAICSSNNKDNIGDSCSLDILVGLLNEIKNITACQADVNKLKDDRNIELERKELEIILNKAATQKSSVDNSLNNIVSITSFGNLALTEMRPSNYLLHLPSRLSNVDEKFKQGGHVIAKNVANTSMSSFKRLGVDKEVSVDFSKTEYVHTFTEVPSNIFPMTINHSTDVAKSFIEVIDTSPKQFYSLCDYQTQYSNSFLSLEHIDSSLNFVPSLHCQNDKNQKICSSKGELRTSNKSKENDKSLQLNITKVNKSYVNHPEFDSMLKIKRDILVTVYSILVLTVFAGLSFPEILY